LGQHGGVAVAQSQAGGLFPGLAEAHRLRQPDVTETVGEQGNAASVLYGLKLT
jgi:hypothetical protein